MQGNINEEDLIKVNDVIEKKIKEKRMKKE